jgi:hypothetical protein
VAEEVAVGVDLDLETSVLEPAVRQPMCLVLFRRTGDPIRARAWPDRVELLQPLEDAIDAQSPNGLIGFAPVPTMTLFVSR